jgi:mono/diheme cytochrome c family protein
MPNRRKTIKRVSGTLFASFACAVFCLAQENMTNPANTGMADPVALLNAFDRYRAGVPTSNPALVMPLVALRGLTGESMNAGGNVNIDLANGSVVSQVRGLPANSAFDLWLIKNRPGPGHSTMAEPQDVLLKVGAYQAQGNVYALSVSLEPHQFATFLPDRAFVVRSSQTPLSAFVLTGSSVLFDRLLHRQVRLTDEPGAIAGFDPLAPATRASNFGELIAEGRHLFLKEQFNGNGRTCGTCHVESNNFTIDPELIATLPRTDPLFVAERNPALAADFEKPDLMRRFGLFLENVDGFDDLKNKFVLRSVQTVLALANSTARPDPSFGLDFSSNGLNADPPERLGWGNDGAPLREFPSVAIVQHATKTLNRKSGVDFRVPTDEELDALAAYQMALGRQEDFNIPTLKLKSTVATKGKALYLDTGNLGEVGHKNCNACHFNAGGTAALSFNPNKPGFPRLDGSPKGFNMGAPTNVNETPLALSLGLPRDGGFGVLAMPLGGFGNFRVVDGARIPFEEFNSPPLVEGRRRFFHNNTAASLEEATAFYGTPAFQSGAFSIGNPAKKATPVTISPDPNNSEVQEIAAFLRVLNALEDIRSAINVAERGRTMTKNDDARELAALALAETCDALRVLSGGAVARALEPGILSARAQLFASSVLLEIAQLSPPASEDNLLQQAANSLRAARSELAEASTLPASFRN